MNQNHIIRLVILLILGGGVVVVSLLAAGKLEKSDRRTGDFFVIDDPGLTTTPAPISSTTTSSPKPAFDNTLTKYLFSDDLVNNFGGRCLDGTSAGYYLGKANDASPNNKKWIIFLQGGSYCNGPFFPYVDVVGSNKDSCTFRATTDRGSSARWVSQRTQSYDTNILSRDSTVNKYFHDWNFVFVPYCSGDLWGGNRIVNSSQSYGLYFAGKAIVTSVFESLRADLSIATDIILSGDSAGGIGTIFNADRMGEWVKSATNGKAFFAAHPQAPWFGTSITFSQFIAQLPSYSNPFRPPPPSLVAFPGHFEAMQFSYHEECANKTDPAYVYYCFITPYLYRFIRTPLFIAQNILDQFEIFLVNGAPTKVDVPLSSYLHFFSINAKQSLQSQIVDKKYDGTYSNPNNYVNGYSGTQLLIDNPQLKYNGVYAALCLKHEIEFTNANPLRYINTNQTRTGYPNVHNKQVHEVFYEWYQYTRDIRMSYDIYTQNVIANKTFYYIDNSPLTLQALCIGTN